jgi:F-type H+-transporting ATPase subunit delta
MIRYQVGRRYSKALFQFSATKEQLAKRLVDLQKFKKLVDDNPRLLQFFNAPEISKDEKKDFLKKILGDDFDPLLYKFLIFLLERKRLTFIREITAEYTKLVRSHLGILDVKLISAFPLDQADKDNLKIKLQKSYPNKEISFTEKVDPKLIGGLIAIVGNKIIDFSMRNRLSELKEKLLASPV